MKEVNTKIIEFIHANKRLSIIIGGMIVLVILVSVLAAVVRPHNKPVVTDDEIFVTIDPSLLQLPEEPLSLPPLKYSRKQKKIWTDADLHYWYTIPDAKQIQELHKINEEKIKNLWESVP